MIERYSRAVMRNIWTEENKFRAYLEVEILAAEAWSTLGVVLATDETTEKAVEKAIKAFNCIKVENKDLHII